MRSGTATLLTDESMQGPNSRAQDAVAMTRGRDDSERGELLSL